MNVTIETDFPVAYDSLDHLHPFGTIKDNNSNLNFIQKLKAINVTSLLDIGCAGGRFVEELNANGISAVGLEGSDISLKMKRASWATIPTKLFTADATKPFTIKYANELIRFDVVTCWEFFEHIKEVDLPQVLENIKQHTAKGSQLICSIASFPSPFQGVDLHETQKGIDFWLQLFNDYRFFRHREMEDYYHNDWVREGSFTLALKKEE